MADRKPWEQQDGEPDKWFARFRCYLALPAAARSVDATYRAQAVAVGSTGSRPGGAWRNAARKWSWRERASAHDARNIDRREARVEARVEKAADAADEWVEQQLVERRQCVERLRIMSQSLLHKSAALLREGDKDALAFGKLALEYARTAQDESRKETAVTDELLGQLLAAAEGKVG